MYSLKSRLFAHQDTQTDAASRQRVAAFEKSMKQSAQLYADSDVPALLAQQPWMKLRSIRYGEQAAPPDTDVVLTMGSWEPIANEEYLMSQVPPGGHNLAHALLGKNAFSFFSSGQGDFRRPRPDHVCRPAWRVHTMSGCPHRCAYCSLGGLHTSMVNLETYGKYLGRLMDENPWETVYLFNDISDTLVLEPEADNIRYFIDFFKQRPDRYFVVHTKSANVDHLLGHDHQQRCIMLFSVTSPSASRSFEPGAPTCEERLAAARKCYEAGYPVRIKFKPIIPVRDWRAEARTMAELALDGMKPEVINLFTIAWMDVETMKRAFKQELLDPEIVAAAEAGAEEMKGSRVAPLPHAVRAMIYDHFIKEIRRVSPDVPITFSTETLEMWKEFGPRLGYTAGDYICGCGAQSIPGLQRLCASPWATCEPKSWDGQPVVMQE